MASGSRETSTSSAPRRLASAPFSGVVVIITTCAPSALANFTPMWPRPPRPITPTFWPGPTFQWRSGDQVGMPAHSSGAAAFRSRVSDTFTTKRCSTTTWSE
ncbi:hypothetical protein G6F58_013315 [Rhizopus delemar]|nr:hypothetical protein G6F58_013315 [Rhizopus delemar]